MTTQEIIDACLREAQNDVVLGMAAAQYILSLPPSVTLALPSPNAALALDSPTEDVDDLPPDDMDIDFAVSLAVLDEDILLGMVGDEWHGPKPPGEGWEAIKPGPRGGKRWKRAEGAPPRRTRGGKAGKVAPSKPEQGRPQPAQPKQEQPAQPAQKKPEQPAQPPSATPSQPAAPDIRGIVDKYTKLGQVKRATFGPGMTPISTVVGTKEHPLSVQEHEIVAQTHARTADTYKKQGKEDLATANMAAAKYHNTAAQRKEQEALATQQAPAQPERPAPAPEPPKKPAEQQPKGPVQSRPTVQPPAPAAAQPSPAQRSQKDGANKEKIAKNLVEGKISKVVKLAGGTTNETFVMHLEDGSKGLFKGGDLGKLNKGRFQAMDSEVAASRVADVIGMGDLVPATVYRKARSSDEFMPEGGQFSEDVGSVQAFVPNARTAMEAVDFNNPDSIWGSDPNDVARAAAFDYLIGSGDRHANNWMLDGKGKISLIDNGIAFWPVAGRGGNKLLGKAMNDKMPIPDEVKTWDWGKVEPILKECRIPSDQAGAVKRRLEHLRDLANRGKSMAEAEL